MEKVALPTSKVITDLQMLEMLSSISAPRTKVYRMKNIKLLLAVTVAAMFNTAQAADIEVFTELDGTRLRNTQ